VHKTHINVLAGTLSTEHGATSTVFYFELPGLVEHKVVREEEEQGREVRTWVSMDARSSERL
jgi:hypothetical protein